VCLAVPSYNVVGSDSRSEDGAQRVNPQQWKNGRCQVQASGPWYLLIDADFDGPSVDYAEKGNKVEYLGHDIVDGDDALRLKVTLKNGDIIYYYLDPDTFLEIRKETQEFIRGSIRENVIDPGSYKQAGGVMFPFYVASGPKMIRAPGSSLPMTRSK
jgi:hypothetical protein